MSPLPHPTLSFVVHLPDPTYDHPPEHQNSCLSLGGNEVSQHNLFLLAELFLNLWVLLFGSRVTTLPLTMEALHPWGSFIHGPFTVP